MGMIPRREHSVFEVRPGAVLQGRSNVSFGTLTGQVGDGQSTAALSTYFRY